MARINDAFEGTPFLLLGPDRWGTNDPQLGVKVNYAEINHCRALHLAMDGEAGEAMCWLTRGYSAECFPAHGRRLPLDPLRHMLRVRRPP